jgi:acyl dehydratase
MKRNSPFGERIAHGVLVLGFTSAASTIAADRMMRACGWKSMASLGYDGIRFVAPVRIGDTITVRYRVTARDTEKRRTTSEFEVVNQRDETVLVGRHIMKWFE